MTDIALRAALLCCLALPAAAQTGPQALAGFKVAPFGNVPPGLTAPDSILILGRNIWVGYGNNVPPDGSSGNSNIVEYDRDGNVVRNLTIAGHNDGLRYDAATGTIWSMQNEDANPDLVFIDPKTGSQTAPYKLRSVNGGGFDDMAFVHGTSFISASNPALHAKGVNTYPALISLSMVNGRPVEQPVLQGDAIAVNAVTHEQVKLNLTDPDSLIVTPDGTLLLDDQGDAQLIELHLDGHGPLVEVVPLIGGVQVDDTVFATSASGTLFVSDTPANAVYALSSRRFALGKPYSATTTVPTGSNYVGELYLDSGATVPVLTGLNAPHGMAFMPR